MSVAAVITTRNEADNIATCIHAFDAVRDRVEVIVVDNASSDGTRGIAAGLGATVLEKGPERSAQRNLGWRTAKADWVVILDADMILPRELVEEMLAVTAPGAAGADGARVDAYWIPEVRTGSGIRVKARNFERSFYDGTCIDALRLFRRDVLERTGGYDESLIAGPEDWELDIRVLGSGAKCEVMKNHLVHNERRLTLKRMLEKKAYYTRSFAAYQEKWKGHPAVKRQFSPFYRFVGVFVEKGKWRRLLRHPVLAAVMYFERIAVGIVYLVNRGKGNG
ncbi:MAG: glycosyltransferase [Kiritimatiellae bacterium]|nr:glycosyltransferase [Kiritimatiellia bacterium]